MVRLTKGDVAPQRGFDCEAPVSPNAIVDERFRFSVYGGSD
jgi:hypothetical protein